VMMAGEHWKKSLPDAIGAVKFEARERDTNRVATLPLPVRTTSPLHCTNELV